MNGISVEVRLPDDQLATLAKLIVSALPGATGERSTYSVAEAATVSGFNESTIRRQVTAGLLPKAQGLKRVRIPKDAFDNWLLGKPVIREAHG